ncbi:MAG: hypothetical protein C4308_13860 [Chitinophagaceae bacterium]
MKNLFDSSVKEEILPRIDKLTLTSQPLWGKMNVNQAMHHMAMGFDIATGKLNPTPVNPPKEKAETYKEMNTVSNGINPQDFEAEKSS